MSPSPESSTQAASTTFNALKVRPGPPLPPSKALHVRPHTILAQSGSGGGTPGSLDQPPPATNEDYESDESSHLSLITESPIPKLRGGE
ncbi:hypothetical protein BU16DRAFT_568415 [Lophium mytilinum]|uniref:Uncharacterized protein n=1 Tax=Lophium mytilinum TaxID=390894 RepID=A0A6A6Q828_9PEZI|nr:hypothetical protein BU16DRAFT_568415 [Lophium mytilinum]